MKDKCTKYEGLFTFSDEETLKQHVENCEDRKKEQALMNRVSELIKEVKPYYISKRKDTAKKKLACAMFAVLICTTTIGVVNFNTDISDIIKYGNTLSAEDLGLPVDEYGLLMVE
jgi:hypothetical protein